MSSILDKIIAHKRGEISKRQQRRLESSLLNDIAEEGDLPRGFIQALADKQAEKQPAVIAEIKQASPSQGVIAPAFDPVFSARSYAEHGATCLSVLTDEEYFKGHDDYLVSVRKAVDLPVLRKEFIIDDYQIAESRILGADAVLLIASVLDDVQLHDYTLMAHDLGMDVLVEVHDGGEFERVLDLPIQFIGVNNRNLHDFSVDLQTCIDLAGRLPEGKSLISESGITTSADIQRLQSAGIYCYLIGGSLMANADPGQALADLIGGVNG